VAEETARSRRQKGRLRELTPEEGAQLEQISRAHAAPASHVARANALLAVAAQHSYTAAARQAGRRSGDAVAMLVARFNREGMAAVFPRQGRDRPARHTVADRERILAEARRAPDRERDGTAAWSLRTLRRALRQSGLPQIGTATIRQVLGGAGLTWQKQRSWRETGTAQRHRRRAGRAVMVTVTDPDAEAKKTDRARLPGGGTAGVDGVVCG